MVTEKCVECRCYEVISKEYTYFTLQTMSTVYGKLPCTPGCTVYNTVHLNVSVHCTVPTKQCTTVHTQK